MNIVAGKLFDSYTGDLVENQLITVSSDLGLILKVDKYEDKKEWFEERGIDLKDDSTIDLRGQTVLPGFVDTHVHMFLHSYSETSWTDQVTRESLAERTIRATTHARRTLMAGYTSVRDLGTEGAQDADLALRKCLSGPNPIAVGPRYFTANRAIVATGSYGPKNPLYPDRDGVEGVIGAEVADGEVECAKAVRRQIGAGADWIKIYADYRIRANMLDVSPAVAAASIGSFTDSEISTMITEAHRLGVKIVAHAQDAETLRRLTADANLHVDSIEHGFDMLALLQDVQEQGCLFPVRSTSTAAMTLPLFWNPTLAVFYSSAGQHSVAWQRAVQSFQLFLQKRPRDIRIACGGDTGAFAHGDNALEMKLMVQLGAGWRETLQWATLAGWKCVRSMRWEGREGAARLARVEQLQEDARIVGDNEVPFGAVRKGFAADIIATTGDFEKNFTSAVDKGSISFVMKGGKVFKRDGKEVA
ncbi:uncharacterized protein PHACADRAFT_189669 [Phanerochaete carnosa HHB-10118-sp]|uniref:Amidohydrolase-related domain-containing protein n=1 Tax=Phanerochaete carnosa (strain HHB-10118-sp) TaxID=650164 RepID=K5WMV5_PHACS|nr:uncharacterized protein PHACADRAFT_189669 [Phanerochaete carnosa HHB-10118-sp]EKM60544.1 hypothetical protein PHACADRAFT_189669 [Phanerochaete carnosa HHB-10118-sp]